MKMFFENVRVNDNIYIVRRNNIIPDLSVGVITDKLGDESGGYMRYYLTYTIEGQTYRVLVNAKTSVFYEGNDCYVTNPQEAQDILLREIEACKERADKTIEKMREHIKELDDMKQFIVSSPNATKESTLEQIIDQLPKSVTTSLGKYNLRLMINEDDKEHMYEAGYVSPVRYPSGYIRFYSPTSFEEAAKKLLDFMLNEQKE